MLSIYTNIKKKRYEMGWTQSELAEKVGYNSKSAIARLEAGDMNLNQSKILKFAEVFGCSPGELMGLDGTIEERDADTQALIDKSALLNRDALKQLIDFANYLYSNENNRRE